MADAQAPLSLHPYRLREVWLDQIEARRLDRTSAGPQPAPLSVQVAVGDPEDAKCQGRLKFRLGTPDSPALLMYVAFDVVAVVEGPKDGADDLLKHFIATQLPRFPHISGTISPHRLVGINRHRRRRGRRGGQGPEFGGG